MTRYRFGYLMGGKPHQGEDQHGRVHADKHPPDIQRFALRY
jgi:hypothetical protein